MILSPGGAGAPGGNAGGALVICIGNPLRGDDAVAAAVADHLRPARPSGDLPPAASRPDSGLPADASVLVVHQLTPELALEIAAASVVVFVDAREDAAPGAVGVAPVEGPPHDASAWSHHVDPASLVVLARTLYGRAPAAWAVTIGGAGWDVGAPLSAAARSAVPTAVEAVMRCLAARAG